MELENTHRERPFILIVDDVAKNIQVLAHILEELDEYDFAAATNGKKALEFIEKKLPDLILLDVMMPEMNGYEVCERLKSDPVTRDIPIIFLTAKTEIQDIVKGFELGAVDYVTKPFNSTELLARVRTHIDLKLSKDIIEHQSEERRELIHVLCHDLKNPLGAITGMLDLIELIPEKKEGSDAFIRKCAEHAIKIIELIRKLQALETKNQALDLVPVNLKDVVNESILILGQRFKEKDVAIELDVPDGLMIMAEKTTLINSVMNNLFTNALKFSFPKEKIEIKASRDGERVVLSVRDHGMGMPPKHLEQLFSVKKSTSRKGTQGEKGTGFGMPLVKKCVEAFGGMIGVNSKEKTDLSKTHGTEVVIHFVGA